jgi:hypothetical protein
MSALVEAAEMIERTRTERMAHGDHDQAARLTELVRLIRDEAEYLEGIERPDATGRRFPMVTASYPPGSALGYLLRYCPATRRLRELRGLSVPEVPTTVGTEEVSPFGDTGPRLVFVGGDL